MKAVLSLSALAFTGVCASTGSKRTSHKYSKRDVNGTYIESTAPLVNIFAGISANETESIIDFLGNQTNITVPGDQTFAAGSPVTSPWLLAPNKTVATAYLDGRGPQPDRYARILGQSNGDGTNCYSQEWMVGPLPISDKTTATPLDYVNNGDGIVYYPCSGVDSSFNTMNETDFTSHNSSRRNIERRNKLYRRDPHDPYEEELGWTGEKLPHDELQPPVTILPDGARHEFDADANWVSWMDFQFFISTGPAGIALHDIRFKGERIVYELGMQEALAHYAGPDGAQTFASYLDVAIGFTDFNIIPGYDGPSYATYADAFCLFESPKDFPINRHQDASYYHATKNIAFIVRSVSTVGNYDYMTTYEFYYDGSIQVIARASGYIQGSDLVNDTAASEYGFKIRDDLMGSMHDHVLNFKIDMDIHGTNNSLFKTEFVPHSQIYDWSNGQTINTMKINRSFVETEDDGKINWAPNAAAGYAVVNKDKPNEFGEYPGFRIFPSTGASIHLTVENSSVFQNTVNWANHQLYALQRHDSEPVSARPGNDLNITDPLVDFNDFFNGESLEQKDIVLYVNLGMHHLPDTYDLPNTVMTSAQSGITIRPQNYLRSENSMSTRQQIHITAANTTTDGTDENADGDSVDTYGIDELQGDYNLEDANPPWYPEVDGSGDGFGDGDNSTDTESRYFLL